MTKTWYWGIIKVRTQTKGEAPVSDDVKRHAVFLSSPDLWQHGFGANHPLKPERLERTVALLNAYEAFATSNAEMQEPSLATKEELALFHTPEYIDAVEALSRGDRGVPAHRYGFGPGDNPVFRGMYDSSRLKSGSSLMGARLLLEGACDVAFSFSGGLHHAGPSQASGFCIFNDAAVAIAWLRQQGMRVAYVDIDAHHGDGVQNAFYDTDQVLTISLHQDGRTIFPGSGFVSETGTGDGKGYSVNVPLLPRTDDETYLWAFRQIVTPLVKRFQPDVLATQLGVDTHYRDPLTYLGLTNNGHEAIFKAFAELATMPWLAFGGGGYNLDVVPRSWTLAFGVMSGQTFADELPKTYRERYGGRWLRDRDQAPSQDRVHNRTRAHAEKVVAALKETYDIA
ncbi:MAG: acetoin utilization protein AcuC [Anaerolineae bacterium]